MESQKVRLYRGKPVMRFHIMAKPIGPTCNLNCTYCYYLSKQGLLDTTNNWRMTDEVLEEFIKQYIEQQNYKEVIFSWQGGEPTLLGLDFFRRVVELEKKYARDGMTAQNDLQTNGTLLDEKWCEFLAENNFLVGLSIDGPEHLHNAYRRTRSGKGSFNRVLRAARLLRKHSVAFNTLSCVNRKTGKEGLDVYRFLRDVVKSPHMQFIPIVEPKVFRDTAPQHWDPETLPVFDSPEAHPGTPGSLVTDWSVDPDDWGDFLIAIFDEWIQKDIDTTQVHFFNSAMWQWAGFVSPLCTLSPMCGKGLAIEHDGTLFACDHYVYPEYELGNVLESSLTRLAFSQRQQKFGYAKEGTLPTRCRECEFEFACFGECPKNRFLRTPEGEVGLNYLCGGWLKYFRHIDPYLKRIAAETAEHGPLGART